MAKDGTNRGGARIGSGAKKKALVDKISDGNPGKRPLSVLSFEENAVDLEAQQMPKPSRLLSAKQADGKRLLAANIFKKTWKWLHERNCAAFVSPDLLERYSISAARWMQCEESVNSQGFLAEHPTTGNPIQSPFVAMSQSYMAQTNRLWMEIFQIVRENCTNDYNPNPVDAMENLLQKSRAAK